MSCSYFVTDQDLSTLLGYLFTKSQWVYFISILTSGMGGLEFNTWLVKKLPSLLFHLVLSVPQALHNKILVLSIF
jgi:hypothetical protein